MNVEKDEFLIDGGKSAMMTMRRRPLTDRSRLELNSTQCSKVYLYLCTFTFYNASRFT